MGIIYAPDGSIASGADYGALTATTLKLVLGKLKMDAFKPSKLQEIIMINDLRKSCGVEPKGGKTITFRRYNDIGVDHDKS